ncbi:MAG TPA: VCBS repeat-containing protein [Puia sp.]|nr:VCBS repeat-containing protein [Puia sp.]
MRSSTRLVAGFFLLSGVFIIVSCTHKKTLFEEISSTKSGIHFNNEIIENDSINPLDLTNIYNGGGVGIGDFNRDGLPDIYFTGNTVSNKLYLNKGDFKFDDITSTAGVGGEGKWCRGVAVVDINNDGWPDIYVCATIRNNPEQRRNLLYINQGLDKNGIPHFKEMAREYGLGDTLYSTMAAFFDYDNDGDLDMYLVVNNIPKGYNANVFKPIVTDGSFPSTGRLYRNDWNDSLKHPVFTDVSKQAGITIEGFGHDVTITDINKDGWKDIYVSNDFLGDDILYINNHDGTFTDKVKTYFKHTSANGMGQDIEDINNDGLADVVELDMDPPDNYRKKLFQNSNNYRTYQNTEYFGYQYQYARNSLQLNQGPRINSNDSIGDPIFSEIGYYCGIEATDWSWTPLVADFDNDGYRDIIVTNGYPKDVNDHDFINFRTQATNLASKKMILSQIPQIKIHSFAFRNNSDLTFTNVSDDWGLMAPSFSNGAAYADLDNDGDLDLIVNNIDDEAHVYRNMSRERDPDNHHYLQIQFAGDSLNKNGFGAWAELHYDKGKQQVYENTPYRGYLSTIQDIAHFGLGNKSIVDSVIIKWPNGKMQLMLNVKANQLLKVNIKNADLKYSFEKERLASNSLFKDITDSVGIHFQQEERDYIDFNIQKLLPHKFSEYGPSIAVGDIDGNGLEDMIVGGSAFHSAQLFLQQPGGRFIQKALLPDGVIKNKLADDLQVLLFDADGDGDLDLYVAAGGYENEHNDPAYQDQFYINDGKGNFKLDTSALPKNFTSKFCVRAADFNHDGKLDLFISGRVDPGNYPKPVSSFIYRNDSKDGHIKFTDVTSAIAKDLINIGMVCDAVWTDYDNDGWPDLVLAGEWMPVTFLRNDHGVFKNATASTGIGNQLGWWNSIAAGDFDNDGRIDYVVGNLGRNSFYRASDEYPMRVYAKDFDKNGIFDMIPSLYLPDVNGEMKEFPAQGRDDLLKQINAMRKKFPTYKSYALAEMNQVLTEDERKDALILSANNLQTCLFHNEGNGKFTMIPLPAQAQFSAINGMVAEDFDGDGNLDLVMNANDYGTEPNVGRYDALNGLYLKGDGKGNFIPWPILQSGIFIPGNGKALVKLQSASGKCLLAAGQNRGPLKVFELKKDIKTIRLGPSDVSALIKYKNGVTRKQEIYYGSSFLSESGRFLNLDKNVVSLEIVDVNGNTRKMQIQ